MRFVFGILFLVVIAAFLPATLAALAAVATITRSIRNAAIGAGVFAATWLLFRRRFDFFVTFEHELTHLLTGLLFLKWPRRMMVHESEGGFVETYGGNFVISLAPYCVPTPALLLLLLGLFVDRRNTQPFMGLYGAALAYHVLSTLSETRFKQPDIRRWGVPFALVVILAGHVIFAGMCAAFLRGGYPGMGAYFHQGTRTAWHFARMLPGKATS